MKWIKVVRVKDKNAVIFLRDEFGEGESEVLVIAKEIIYFEYSSVRYSGSTLNCQEERFDRRGQNLSGFTG